MGGTLYGFRSWGVKLKGFGSLMVCSLLENEKQCLVNLGVQRFRDLVARCLGWWGLSLKRCEAVGHVRCGYFFKTMGLRTNFWCLSLLAATT